VHFIIKNQNTSSRTKYIDIRAHLIREHCTNKIFDVIKVDTSEQDGDPLTKNLNENDHNRHSENFRNGKPLVYQNWTALTQQISNKN